MTAESNSIQELNRQGMSTEDIAESLGISSAIVKVTLGKSPEVTEEEHIELKKIILDIANGRLVGTTIENSIQAAVYLHKSSTEERRLNGGNQNVTNLMDMLRQKAADKLKMIDVSPA